MKKSVLQLLAYAIQAPLKSSEQNELLRALEVEVEENEQDIETLALTIIEQGKQIAALKKQVNAKARSTKK